MMICEGKGRPKSVHSAISRRTVSVLLVLCGCLALSPGFAGAGVLEYLRDRGEDLLDVVRLRVFLPHRAEAYGAKARVTALAQVGYVHVKGKAVGMDRRAIGVNAEERTEGGLSALYFSRTRMATLWGNQFLYPESRWNASHPRGVIRNKTAWDDARLHPDSCGAELELGLIGVDVGVYPLEAVDFVTGWFFIDPYGDDMSYVDSLEEFPAPVEEEPAAEVSETSPSLTQPQEINAQAQPAPSSNMEPSPELAPDSAPSAAEGQNSTLNSQLVTPQDMQALRQPGKDSAAEAVVIPSPSPTPAAASAPDSSSAPAPAPGEQTKGQR